MRSFLTLAKALSDESRVRALLALREGELCVCQLVDLLGSAPSTVSKHMTLLVQADLVICRKEGRWHYYRLPNAKDASPIVRTAMKWVREFAGDSAVAAQDQKRLKEICRKDKEVLSSCCYRS